MSSFRQQKNRLFTLLAQPDWQYKIQEELQNSQNLQEYVSPLLSFLLRHEVRWQSIWSFGLLMDLIAQKDKEQARNIMRRLMWSMNEESGNIGWGIPECMASCFAKNALLASEYAKILYSYAIDTGDDDNFIEHEPLRLGVYWGIAHMARSLPSSINKSLATLASALAEANPQAKIIALWGILGMLQAKDIKAQMHLIPDVLKDITRLATQCLNEDDAQAEIFDMQELKVYYMHSLAQQVLDLLR